MRVIFKGLLIKSKGQTNSHFSLAALGQQFSSGALLWRWHIFWRCGLSLAKEQLSSSHPGHGLLSSHLLVSLIFKNKTVLVVLRIAAVGRDEAANRALSFSRKSAFVRAVVEDHPAL
jgi:hypothetical protein